MSIKEQIRELAEENAKDIVEVAFEIIEEKIKASANKIDDMFLGVLPAVKAQALKLVDKINPND